MIKSSDTQEKNAETSLFELLRHLHENEAGKGDAGHLFFGQQLDLAESSAYLKQIRARVREEKRAMADRERRRRKIIVAIMESQREREVSTVELLFFLLLLLLHERQQWEGNI